MYSVGFIISWAAAGKQKIPTEKLSKLLLKKIVDLDGFLLRLVLNLPLNCFAHAGERVMIFILFILLQ